MRAYAYVVGPQDDLWMNLFDLVGTLGFAGRSSFRGLAQVEQQLAETPICYFLFSPVEDLAPIRTTAAAIRQSQNDRLRFLPMIYMTHEASAQTIASCVNMGFDDIVALPQSPEALKLRLSRQLGVPQTFYEAGNYFGPDRRNRIAGLEQVAAANRVGGPFRRLQIIRDPDKGVTIQREQRVATGAVAAMQTLQ
jgi:CheY-like chemotaxis protein